MPHQICGPPAAEEQEVEDALKSSKRTDFSTPQENQKSPIDPTAAAMRKAKQSKRASDQPTVGVNAYTAGGSVTDSGGGVQWNDGNITNDESGECHCYCPRIT